jgi:hypothetical protein
MDTLNEYLVACHISDNAPAVFRDLPGAPERTIILFSWHRPDEEVIFALGQLDRAGYPGLCARRATDTDLGRWHAEGFNLLFDPPLIERVRVVGWQEESLLC